jgi:type III secretory pathway component EscS
MTPADLHELAIEALTLVLMLSLPILGAAILAGILAGLFQSFTRMSEPTIGHVSRIAAVLAAAAATAPWIAHNVSRFATHAWILLQEVGR